MNSNARARPLLVALLFAATFWPAAAPAKTPVDIGVTKVHLPGLPAYSVTVTNHGPAITQGKIVLVDLVPMNLTITSMSAPTPWTCTPFVGPAVPGPDVITCTATFSGLASGASLPGIALKFTGGSHCPNCVRARLYLKNSFGAYVEFHEANTANNWSCAF